MTSSMDFAWFSSKKDFIDYERSLIERNRLEAEIKVSSAGKVRGYCSTCSANTWFTVCTGARFDDRPNLREGMQCQTCGLSSRQRLVHLAFLNSVMHGKSAVNGSGAILERHTRLFRALRRSDSGVAGSEYRGERALKGKLYFRFMRGRLPIPKLSRHESITDMSYSDTSLNYLIHTDVLEHVEDTTKALAECRRVLKVDSPLLFTVPFFSTLEDSLVRGYTDSHGKLIELMPGEYHDDGVAGKGIYTFYNFGWSFFNLMKEMFSVVEIGVAYNPKQGLLFSDSKQSRWNMAPLVFRCYR